MLPWHMILSLAFLAIAKCRGANLTTRSESYMQVGRWWVAKEGEEYNRSQVIRIGVPLTLSRDARYGGIAAHMQRAFQMYFSTLAEQRGGISIGGIQHAVELSFVDDKSDAARVQQIATTLVASMRIKFLLGPYSSGLTEAVAHVVQQHDAVLVASASAASSVFSNRSRIFGVLMPAPKFLLPALQSLLELGATRFGFIQEDVRFTLDACSALAGLSRTIGLKTFGRTVAAGAAKLAVRNEIEYMKSVNADVLVGCVYTDVCHKIVESMYELDFNPKAVVLTICVTADGFMETFGLRGQFVMGAAPWATSLNLSSQLTDISVTEFSKKYKEESGQEPPYQAAAAFAACETLVYGLEQAGSLDPAAVAQAIQGLTKPTIFGAMSFNSNGQSEVLPKAVQFQHPTTETYWTVAPEASAQRRIVYPKPTWTELKCLDDSRHLRYGFVLNEITGKSDCQPCGTKLIGVYNSTLQRRSCMSCVAGHEVAIHPDSFEGEETYCKPCREGYFLAHRSAHSACLICPPGQFQNRSGQSACIQCRAGTFSAAPGSTRCELCSDLASDGWNYFAAEQGAESCTPCPVNGLCKADHHGFHTSVTNTAGYFLINKTCSDEACIHHCPHGGGLACLANARCYEDPKTGEPSMEGPLCGVCRAGYGRTRFVFNTCERCPSVVVAFLGATLNMLIVGAIIATLSSVTLVQDFSKPSQHLHAAIFKQVLNYLHMTHVTATLTEYNGMPGADGCKRFLRTFQIIVGVTSVDFSNLSAWCFTEHVAPGIAGYKAATVAGILWIPIWLLMGMLSFFAVQVVYLFMGWVPPQRRFLRALIAMTLYVSLSRIPSLLLISFSCYEADESRHLLDTNVKCDTHDHQLWQGIGFVGFIIFSCGIPLFFLRLMFYYKRRDEINEPDVQAMLGFLQSGLEPQLHYFECIFMCRKALFQLVQYLPGHSIRSQVVQCYALMAISGLFLIIHIHYRPYDNRAYFLLDKIEGASLLAIFLTVAGQLGLWSADRDDIREQHPLYRSVVVVFVYAAVLGCHARFIMYVCWGCLRQSVVSWCTCWPFQWLLGADSVEVTERGLLFHDLSDSSKELLQSLIAELVGQCAEENSSVEYALLGKAMQRICVHANFVATKRKYVNSDPMRFHKRFLRSKATLLPVGSNFAVGALDRLDRGLRRSFQLPVSPRGMSEELTIDSMQTFDARNIAATHGSHFSVEDLHEAFLLLGADALVVQAHVEDQIQSQTLEQQEACHEEGQQDDSMPCLEKAQLDQQDLESRLQNQRSERVKLQLLAAALTEELRTVQSALAERPPRCASRRQQCEASSLDCNQARVVMVKLLPPLFLDKPVDGSGMQSQSRASDPLASVRLSSDRRSCSSGEHSIREADDIEPPPHEELQDLKVADAQGINKESHLSLQHRLSWDGIAASQTSEPRLHADAVLSAETATGPLVLSRLDSKCLARELQKADEAWAQHALSTSTKDQASGSNASGTSQKHVAEVWRRVS